MSYKKFKPNQTKFFFKNILTLNIISVYRRIKLDSAQKRFPTSRT